MKVSNNFILQEFIDKETYQRWGNKSIWFIDPKLYIIAQALRVRYGSIKINTWNTGNDRNWSGLRTIKSPYYSSYSQHTFGRAIDMIFSNYNAQQIRDFIKEDEQYWFDLGVRGIEENVSWIHLDVRNTNQNKIKWFKI